MLFLLVWTVHQSAGAFRDTIANSTAGFHSHRLGSVFAGVCFFRVRKKMPFVGAGMLSLGFLLWGVYLASYPFSQKHQEPLQCGFFIAAVLQLFIAVSMIVLVMEEVRYNAEQMRAEIAAVRSEKEALQVKVLTTEEQCRNLYDQVRLTEGVQKAYDELRRTQQVVVQQERLRALGQMASGVAHDINNALSPDRRLFRTVAQHAAGSAGQRARQYLQTINKSGEDIAHIVARMREFYRRRSDTRATGPRWTSTKSSRKSSNLPVPAGATFRNAKASPSRSSLNLESNLPLLFSDPSDLREALINLIFNAVDALPQGGIITLVTRSVNRPAQEEKPAAEQQLQVEVRDNGIGMDEKTRQRCLEPFFSTKAKRGGTGLGLAMVYGMMQRHEGDRNRECSRQGTCIRLVFPFAACLHRPRPAPRRKAKKSRALNLLCIDDDEQTPDFSRLFWGNSIIRSRRLPTARRAWNLFRRSGRKPNPTRR